MAFDITDIAGLRRSPTQAGAAARMAPQNVFPYRPGASPVPETPSTAPAAPRKTRNQIAWEAVQLNPNRGTLPPELSTGSRMLDDELFRAARRMSGMANSRAAVEELKRKQWLTGERTLADEMPGATAPDYAGAWAPEKQVGPPDNGVWTAPDGTRYAMRDGVPVGRSGTAGGQWSMEQGNVGEFTGGSDRETRRNILRDEILGKMAEAPVPKAPPSAVAPAVSAAPQTPAQAAPAAPQTPAQPALSPRAADQATRAQQRNTLIQTVQQTRNMGAALDAAENMGLLPPTEKRILQSELEGERSKTDEALRKEGSRQQAIQSELEAIDKRLESGIQQQRRSSIFPASWGPSGGKMSGEERGQLAKRARELQTQLEESRKKGDEIAAKARANRERILSEALAKIVDGLK